VHNAWRREWELPGGRIEDGETARDAAVREFLEETGTPVGDVDFVGVGTVQLGHERRIEYAAVYRTTLDHVADFRPNDEIDQLQWWDLRAEVPRLSAIDAHLAQLALGNPRPAAG
jgi:8-oxo-dGTP diphosphatase